MIQYDDNPATIIARPKPTTDADKLHEEIDAMVRR
jgi:hypothetical protein